MRLQVLASLISLSLASQELPLSTQEALRNRMAPGRFLVAGVDIELGQSWILQDEVISAIQISQLGQRVVTGKAGQALREFLRGPGWVLVSPTGRVVAQGRGTPEPRRIREEMAKAGWSWIREDLKSHLARHPEDGQAWVELLADLTRQAAQGWIPDTDTHLPLSAASRERLLSELEAAVTGLEKVPEVGQAWLQPPRQGIHYVPMILGVSELRKEPRVRILLERIAAPFAELLSQDPDNGRTWDHFHTAYPPDGSTTFKEASELLDRLERVPGRPWPPARAAIDILLGELDNPEEMLFKASSLLDQNLEPGMVRRLGKAHRLEALQTWGELRLEAWVRLGKIEEALASLEDLRRRSGSLWPEVGKVLRGHTYLKPEPDDPETALSPSQRRKFIQMLDLPPLADVPQPPLQPLRACFVGNQDPLSWGRLQVHPLLDPWDPSELSWKPLSQAEVERLGEFQGWVVMRGEDILAKGEGLPAAENLADILRRQGTPRLEALDEFLQRHPERLDGRRERLSCLQARMPHPRLEARLVEDLEFLAGALPANLRVEPALLRAAAGRVTGKLAERLRHWPFHEEAWAAYVDWSALDPQALRPGDLLAEIPTWPRLRGNLQPGPVPAGLALAVCRRLGRAGRWKEVSGWFDAVWHGGLRHFLDQGRLLQDAPDAKEPSQFSRNLALVRELVSWCGKAYAELGRQSDRAAFGQELESLRPGLGASLVNPPKDRVP